MTTRWGIASAGRISNDFTAAVHSLPSTDHQLVAVGARTLNSAKDFAKKFDITRAYGSYEELSKDPAIDIVYIGSIAPHHVSISKLMLQAGKHVLCETPFCINERQVREVFAVAKEKKLFIMQGFWSRFFPVYHKLKEELKKGTIGEPRVVSVNFGAFVAPLSDDFAKRVRDKELGGGALLELGCYTVQMAELVFGGIPEKISVVGTLQPTGVDETSVTTLVYPGARMASLTCSLSSTLCQTAYIQGTKGVIQIPDFWSPTEITVNGEKSEFPLPKVNKPFVYTHGEGFSYEAQHVREMLQKGALESPLMSHSSTLNIVRILDEARRQLGVTYDADRI